MWSELTWQRLKDPAIARDVEELREDTVRFLLWTAAAVYLSWNLVSVYESPPRSFPHYSVLFAIVGSGLLLTYLSLRCKPYLAAACFLLSSVVAVIAAMWIFTASLPTLFLPLIALAAVVLINPLAGVAISMTSLSVLVVLWETGPCSFLTPEQLLRPGISSLVTVAVAWALGRNMVTVVEWALDSYAQALRKTQAAQSHRAELVQALKQLDQAYYRLERANAALELAWKTVEATERSKSEFVTNISHELRTPLNLIVGFSEMIVMSPEDYGEPLSTEYRGDMIAIYRSAQHLLTLTNDVLDLARVGIARLSLAREPVDLTQVINDASDMVRDYLKAKGLWLRVEVDEGLPILVVDRLRIRQVFLNLLTNAARFTESGGITISASMRTDGWVMVKVADTGRGIAPEDISKVFAEFYHTDDAESQTRQTRFGGVGLGLPLSRKLVELHGGQMGIQNTASIGTVFWFTLPTAVIDGDARDTSAGLFHTTTSNGATERIIVLVGCNSSVARLLQNHLCGFRVIVASDMAGALSTAIDVRANAILVDIDTVRLDEYPDSPIPIIRLPLPHEERIAEVLGAAAYLVKPVTRADLRGAISRLGRRIRTVLIVDDDPRFSRLLMRFLQGTEGTQCRVVVARDGREAISLMDADPPDLVLLDLIMPNLGGADVLSEMAANPRLAGIPAIIISAWEQGGSQLMLRGPVSLAMPEGAPFGELLCVVESLLGALPPPRQYLTDHCLASRVYPTGHGPA